MGYYFITYLCFFIPDLSAGLYDAEVFKEQLDLLQLGELEGSRLSQDLAELAITLSWSTT